MKDKGWPFYKQEEYLISTLKIEFKNPKFWFFLGMIFYENYEMDKAKDYFLKNALFCFNKPFEKNKNKGKTIYCELFDDPRDLFSLSYSEYLEFLNKSLDHLIIIYGTSCFFEGFALLDITPQKPELIERYEVIIRADYNELMEKKEELINQKIQKIQKNQEIASILISDEGLCVICRIEIKDKSLICSNCHAKFHKKCFISWLEINKSCPVCQQKLELFE